MGLDIMLYKWDAAGDDAKVVENEELDEFKKYFGDKLIQEEAEYIDWEKTFKARNLNFDDYDSSMEFNGKFHFFGFDENKQLSHEQVFEFKDCHVYVATDNVLYVNQIGYQRKGMNDAFYKEIENGVSILNKEVAETLLKYVHPQYKESFQENILSPFIEGETIILVEW